MNTWPPREGMPDLEAHLRPLRQIVDRWGRRRLIIGALAIVGLLWFASGLYIVGPGERGVELLFGRVSGQTEPGLRYRLPAPIQQHRVVDIASVRRAEVGFRTNGGSSRSVPNESHMLTGDENIVDVQLFVQYRGGEVQASVFARMQAERQRIALRYRAEGEEKGREIRAHADKEREIILAKAYQESQGLRGAGDAEATAVTGQAFGRDPGFYGFLRRLETYERVFSPDTTIVLRSDSDLLRYLNSPREKR